LLPVAILAHSRSLATRRFSPAPGPERREDIWPTDKAPVIRRIEAGTNEFAALRWTFFRTGRL
jgi:putative SOS response-associated peptidase YedK